jgi:tetratricopeptide (TPR) repeat protein
LLWNLGYVLLYVGRTEESAGTYAGRVEESAAAFSRLLELNPTGGAGGYAGMASALLFMGRYPEALAAAKKETDEGRRLAVLPAILWAMGRRSESDAALHRLEERRASVSASAIAGNYAYRGDSDAAIEWLYRSYSQHEVLLRNVKVNPWLRSLHSDSRYQTLLVEMKLID